MKILVVVAHPDDEVLGCGGTIAKHSSNGDTVNSIIVAEGLTSRDNIRKTDLRKKELEKLKLHSLKAAKILGIKSTHFFDLPDNRLDSVDLIDITKKIEQYVFKLKPDIIYTHHYGDLNIDHRTVHNAVMTACRPFSSHFIKKILTFENPSSTEWQSLSFNSYFKPNYFENIETHINKKIRAMKQYKTELKKWPHTRSLEFLNILAKFRGSISGLKYAEAFFVERIINNKK